MSSFWQRHSSDLFCHSMYMYMYIFKEKQMKTVSCLPYNLLGFELSCYAIRPSRKSTTAMKIPLKYHLIPKEEKNIYCF